MPAPRTISLIGATGVGIGAIVGGGILVLAGVAFRATGPGAIAAFLGNGLIALLTALTFAELSTAFPESGGAYTYAKKVLSLRVAFAVGWVVWFAYIVAGALYALGFAEYAVLALREGWAAAGAEPPAWLRSRNTVLLFAVFATGGYTLSLIRKATGGPQWATAGKVILFALLILAGLWVLAGRPSGTVRAGLLPFFPGGGLGLAQAMGFTFIALQGFEVIATVAGEVREPARTLPRAMLLSLGSALVIYIPFLFVCAVVGVERGQSITALSAANPETVMAVAVGNFLGPAGYWLVVVVAILSTLTALQANVLAASRMALSMARDRTLPAVLAEVHAVRETPVMAVYASALAMVAIMLVVPNVAAAGAAASLIFLIAFALAHWTGLLMRRRAGEARAPFRTPWFPAVPVVGGLACAGLAVFQAVAVPSAGAIAAVWLGLGVILYMGLFARRAEMLDAFTEGVDPDLVKFRGRAPVVLVPIANPASAPSLVAVANALAPPQVGRVLLLAVVRRPAERADAETVARSVAAVQEVLREALCTALSAELAPEALMTVAPAPWPEIVRIAETRGCENLLLGLHRIDAATAAGGSAEGSVPLEALLNQVHCDVSILRATPGWQLEESRRILIPVGGKGEQDELRARLLGSLCRGGERRLVFLRVLPAGASEGEKADAERTLRRLAATESPEGSQILVRCSDDVVATIVEHAGVSDLVILGLPRIRGRKLIGELAIRVAQQVSCPTIMISRHG